MDGHDLTLANDSGLSTGAVIGVAEVQTIGASVGWKTPDPRQSLIAHTEPHGRDSPAQPAPDLLGVVAHEPIETSSGVRSSAVFWSSS